MQQHSKTTPVRNQSSVASTSKKGASSVQAKLKVGQPNDSYEKEADQVADQVVQMKPNDAGTYNPAPLFSTTQSNNNQVSTKKDDEPELQRKTEASELAPAESSTTLQSTAPVVQRKKDEELIQKKGGEGEGETAPSDIESRISSSKGIGSPMAGNTLGHMNQAFNADFSSVSIHTDQQAVQMSQDLNAKAFTSGNDIYFNQGQYAPETTGGQRLLAHELTHTMQQGATSHIRKEGNDNPSNPQPIERNEEIEEFLKSVNDDFNQNVEFEMKDWESKNPNHTALERAEKLKATREDEMKFQKSLFTDEYLSGLGMNPAEVRAYIANRKLEIETQVENISGNVKKVEAFTPAFESKYSELLQLITQKIEKLATKISGTSDFNKERYYNAQYQELKASLTYFKKENTKKYFSLIKKDIEAIDELITEIKEYPFPYNAKTADQHGQYLLESAATLRRYAQNVDLYIESMVLAGENLSYSLSLVENIVSGPEGSESAGGDKETEGGKPESDAPPKEAPGPDTKPEKDPDAPKNDEKVIEEEDPELSDEKIEEEEADEEFKDFMSRLKEIATVEDSLGIDETGFLAKLKAMSPNEREQFLEYLKGMMEKGSDEEEEEKSILASEAMAKFDKLTELERKILDTNRKLRQDSDRAKGEKISIDLGELESPTNPDGKTAQEHLEEMSQADSVLNKIKEQAGVKGDSWGFDLGWSPFLTEMSVFYALLAGGGKRSEGVKDISQELMGNLGKIKDEMNNLVLESALLAIPAILPEPASTAAAAAQLAIKARRIKKIVEVGQTVYDVGTKVHDFHQAIQNPALKEALNDIEGKFQQVEELEKKLSAYGELDDEALEDELFALEEQLRSDLLELVSSKGDVIMEFLYIPEPKDASPDFLIDELIKILYDLPKGLASFEAMNATYSGINSKGSPTKDELAMLSLQAVDTGVYLYPFVGFLAEAGNNALDGLGSMEFSDLFGKKKKDRKRSKKYKEAPKTKAGRKKDSKKKFEKLDPKKYDYDNNDLKNDYLSKYEKRFETYLHDPKNSLYGGYWTADYFKYVARDYYKELKTDARRDTVKAKPKGKKTKVNAPAPMFKLTGWNLSGNQFSFKLKVNPTVDVESLTNRSIEWKTFKDAGGIPYTFEAMGSTKDKRIRKKEIKKWLSDNGYDFTYEVDGAGKPVRNEAHLHIRRGKKESEYLHLDKGVIKQQVHTDLNRAVKSFFGKKIKSNKDLPEGYVIKSSPTPLEPGRKAISKKKGLPAHMPKLNWDGNQLTDVAPNKVPKQIKPLSNHKVQSDPYDYKKSVKSMFDIAPDGTEVAKPGFKMQKKDSSKQWIDYLEKHADSNGKKRPKKVEVDLGYTVNARANGDQLSSYKLPEMKVSDDNGHLAARRFGAKEFFNNLVPMDTQKNQKGDWSKMEHAIAQKYIGRYAIPGNFVHATIDLHYDETDSRRPDSFKVKWQEKINPSTNQPEQTLPDGSKRKADGELDMKN